MTTMGQIGLRERKKLKTRHALIDAGLDLFLAQGYEHTTIEQIAAAVEVSPRTFFRYFAGKDDLALYHMADLEIAVTEELESRPAGESPGTALINTFRTVTRGLTASGQADKERYTKTRRLLDATPALLSTAVGRAAGLESRLAGLVARRQGAEGPPDRRACLVVAFVTAAARVGFECAGAHEEDLAALVARVDETLTLAERSFRPGWDTLDGI
ncbi:TetR family transcriptional regulator [Spongiactinospora gelatinilytica]|uniref:TetR family transcriptional regulator n=1 Tax=Spongiactinospora gelatinilytica TaxID=2666298 RepID=A0A2W2GW39_9ACTN|nr:TetR family transcriptional regulator [Spongiactinospora gelatinilytica]PZG52152.1 TetR family transcriptional regulator [Spongiactinospora gelatinilytica]